MDRANVDVGSRLGLRRTVTLAALALSLLTCASAVSLIVLTTSLHDASVTMRETIRGVRVARQTEVDLIRHDQTDAPAERARIDAKIRTTLLDAARYPASSETTAVFRDEARARVEHYLDVSAGGKLLDGAREELSAALSSLNSVVHANVEDAERASVGTARLDELGNVIGGALAVAMVAVPALLVVWIRRSVVRPMLSLSDAMERFGRGDLSVRATPDGAVELQRMMAQFNSMGEALTRQHEARLAHLAGVAHDLRNPLSALQMAAALIEPDKSLPPEPQVRRTLEVVHRQVGRLSRMVDDLLDATRIEAGHLTLKLEERDLRLDVSEVADRFQDTSDLHEIVLELPSEPLIVRCDPLRIEQLLTNLVSNAIKYSPRGGVVHLLAAREGNSARVSVSDEGVGIAAADLDEIWEPFRRRGISVESIPGVGLGLWTARKIADAHQGRLSVESVPGRGSTFALSLPLVLPTTRPHSKTSAPYGVAVSHG